MQDMNVRGTWVHFPVGVATFSIFSLWNLNEWSDLFGHYSVCSVAWMLCCLLKNSSDLKNSKNETMFHIILSNFEFETPPQPKF